MRAAALHPQLDLLLQIQDLMNQQRELVGAEGEATREGARVEVEEFHVDVEQAVATIEAKIQDLVAELEPEIRSHYQRIARGRKRVVVPAINGVCYGCFVSVATAEWPDVARNDNVRHCVNCGRFLYAPS